MATEGRQKMEEVTLRGNLDKFHRGVFQMHIVKLDNVSKTYNMGEIKVDALQDVNLTIDKGEFVSIVGPSGCGKSTLLDMIGCLNRPTNGNVHIEGKNTSDMDDNELAKIRGMKIGFIFQTFNLIERLTAVENVMLPMIFAHHDGNRIERASELLELVGLMNREHHRPSQLSGGQRQRVAIARALVNNPAVIIADEPTGNLDTKSGKEVFELLQNLNKKQGRTLILVTHDIKLAGSGKRVVQMLDGKIVRDSGKRKNKKLYK